MMDRVPRRGAVRCGGGVGQPGSKSQWLVMRRTRQLQRIKHVLADETARHERTAEALNDH